MICDIYDTIRDHPSRKDGRGASYSTWPCHSMMVFSRSSVLALIRMRSSREMIRVQRVESAMVVPIGSKKGGSGCLSHIPVGRVLLTRSPRIAFGCNVGNSRFKVA